MEASGGGSDGGGGGDMDAESEMKERELTHDFLSGKMSFSEYAQRMDGDGMEDEEEEAAAAAALLEVGESGNGSDLTDDRKRRRTRRKLPPALKGLVGEANLRWARGDEATAERMCLEVIRQAPTAPEPYLTLAQIYERSAPGKALQLELIAAHLSPGDADRWLRLADASEAAGDAQQADACLAKALLAAPGDVTLHLRRVRLFEAAGDARAAARARLRALHHMRPPQHSQLAAATARRLARHHCDEGEVARARDALLLLAERFPDAVAAAVDLLNWLLETLLALGDHRRCLELLATHCAVRVELELDGDGGGGGGADDGVALVSCRVPPATPIDLHTKLVVCVVRACSRISASQLDALLEPLERGGAEGCERNGDLYLDVAEALAARGRHEDALRLLVPLVATENFGRLAAVHLRHAECLEASGRLDASVAAYREVVRLEPDHLDARRPLAELLVRLGRVSEAAAALDVTDGDAPLCARLLYRRCELLRQLRRWRAYWSSVATLLSRHCTRIRNRDEACKLTYATVAGRKSGAVRALRAERGEDPGDGGAARFAAHDDASDGPPTATDEWRMLVDTVASCWRRRRTDLAQRFSVEALGSRRFASWARDAELLAAAACVRNNDAYQAYNLVREMVLRAPRNPRAINLYNVVIQRSDDSRHNRFLMRLMTRVAPTPDEHLRLLHANNCLIAGTYKYALSEYVAAYRLRERPLPALLVAVSLLHMASQKFSAKKAHLVVQAIGFLREYRRLRGAAAEQETAYNIGRGFHQLGLLHLAAANYRRALLALPPPDVAPLDAFDLRREAAFNLHLIYLSSGSRDLANMYLLEHIVV